MKYTSVQLHVARIFLFKPSYIILILPDNHRKVEKLLDSSACNGHNTLPILCYTILYEAVLLIFRDPTKKIFFIFSSLALSVLCLCIFDYSSKSSGNYKH